MPQGDNKTTEDQRWDRRIQVIRLRAQGVSVYEIAKQLGVTPHTIYNDQQKYYEVMERNESRDFRVQRVLAQYDEIIRRGWAILQQALARDRDFPAPQVLQQIANAVAGKARALGLDRGINVTQNTHVTQQAISLTGLTKEEALERLTHRLTDRRPAAAGV